MSKLPEYGDPAALYVVDLYAYMHRYFHATPAYAAQNFAAMLKKLLGMRNPARIAVAEDLPWPTFRHELAPGIYKANRDPRTGSEATGLLEQIRIVGTILDDVFGIRRLAVKGFEADDIIASLVSWGEEEGLKPVIVGLDKDLMQLVSAHTVMWDGKKLAAGPEEVRTKFGVEPRQIVDYLSMVGDSSDNIPGVWGCGPVAAVGVLKTFATLEHALTSAEAGKDAHPFWKSNPKIWSRLAGARSAAELARKLVRLRHDVPLKLGSLDDLRVE